MEKRLLLCCTLDVLVQPQKILAGLLRLLHGRIKGTLEVQEGPQSGSLQLVHLLD